MKVAIIVECFPSISETFVLNQILDFINSGAQVFIIAYQPSPHSLNSFAPSLSTLTDKIIYISLSDSALMRNIRHLSAFRGKTMAVIQVYILNLLQKTASRLHALPDFDFIIAHFGPQGALALRLREMGLISGKIATFFHGYDLSRFRILNLYRTAYRDLFTKTEKLFVVSDFWRNKLLTLGCPENLAITQHMGVDTDYFRYKPKTDLGSPLLIISVARLTEKKGLAYAIRAIAELSRKVKLEYIIFGSGSLNKSLKKLIQNFNAEASIKLAGARSQEYIHQYLKQADLMLLPSVTAANGDMEGIPVSLMEAMACGVPVITTAHSGIAELVTDNISGLLVPERDSQAIKHKVEAFLSMTSKERQHIKDSARNVVEEHFCRKIQHQKLLAALN